MAKNIEELRDELSHKLRSAKDMLDKAEKEGREFTESEQSESDQLLADADGIKKQIEAAEAHEARAKRIRDEVTGLMQPQKPKTDRNKPNADADTPTVVTTGYRLGKTKAFKNTTEGQADAYRSGKWVLAALLENRAAQKWCRDQGIDYRAQSEGVNTAGGFLVPNEFSQAIIDLREQYGVFRRECRVIPMGRDTIDIPRRASGLTANFIGEGVAQTAQDKAWSMVSLVAKKLGILTVVSSELDEDAVISIADDLASEMAYAFALKEDQCGFLGDGTSTYGGIIGVNVKIIDGTHTAGAVDCATAGHDTLVEVDNADLATLMGKVPQYALPNAKFYCSQVAKATVFDRLKAIAGGNTIQTLDGKPMDTHLGYPIVVSQVMPTAPGNNEVFLLFGDLSKAAVLGERRGITISRSSEYKFAEDQIAYKATGRVDINVHDLGDTSTAGPIVALIGFTS